MANGFLPQLSHLMKVMMVPGWLGDEDPLRNVIPIGADIGLVEPELNMKSLGYKIMNLEYGTQLKLHF